MTIFKKIKFKSSLLIGMLFSAISIKAQLCTGCTSVISGGSANFSVNVGEVVCISSGVTYTGNITLNGGTLCNEGTLTRVNFKKGAFNNYGIFNDANAITINANGNLVINNYGSARFLVTGGMAVTASNMVDTVVFNNFTGGLFNTGSGLSTHDVQFRIYNGDNSGGTGGGGVGVSAVFNVGGAFAVGDATEFRLRNFGTGYFNVSGNMALNATGNKSLANYGIINVNNAFNMSGTGNVTDVIDVYNFSQLNVTGNISTGINNSAVNINNNAGAIFYSGISITMSKATNNLINDGEIYTGQDLIVQNGAATNNNYFSVNRDMKVNTGNFINNNGAYVLIGRNFIAQNQGIVSNRSTLQPFGNLQVNSQSSFVNLYDGRAIPNVSAVIQGTSTLINYGNFATPGPIKITSSTFSNEATGNFSSGQDITMATNANAINSGTMIAGRDLKLTGSNFTNGNYVNVIEEFLPQGSSNAMNNGTIDVGMNVKITTSTLTNNYYIFASNNFSTTNASAKFDNNNLLTVGNEFKNTGVTSLGPRGYITSSDFLNVGSSASVNATFNTLDTTNFVNDTTLYSRIVVKNNSETTGYITGNLIFYDETLIGTSNNAGYGFDVVTNPTRIMNSVLYVNKSGGPGLPIYFNCKRLPFIYTFNGFSNPAVVCKNSTSNVNLSVSAQLWTNQPPGPNIPMPVGTNIVWQPGNLSGQNVVATIVNPQANVGFVANITFLGCPIQVFVTVFLSGLTANAGPDILIPISGSTPIGGTPSSASAGVFPYQYSWLPNISLSNNLVSNPTANPFIPTTYTVTVTDANGCIDIDDMTVYFPQLSYAILKKELDGGFFDVTPSKNPTYGNVLNFLFEEEYVNNNVNLQYKILRMDRSVVVGIPNQSVAYKENRYSINLAPFGLTPPNSYYILEVTDKKGEKTYLRFKY